MNIQKSNCPACGAPLFVEGDSRRTNCQYCGSNLSIEYNHGKIYASLSSEDVNKFARSISTNSSELAIKRLKEEIRDLSMRKSQIQASYDQKKAQLNPGFVTAEKGCSKYLLTAGGIVGLLSLIGFWAGAWKSTNVGLLVTAIVLIAGYFGYNAYVDIKAENRNSEIRDQITEGEARLNSEQKKELEPIDARIGQKQRELEEHEEIVSRKM